MSATSHARQKCVIINKHRPIKYETTENKPNLLTWMNETEANLTRDVCNNKETFDSISLL